MQGPLLSYPARVSLEFDKGADGHLSSFSALSASLILASVALFRLHPNESIYRAGIVRRLFLNVLDLPFICDCHKLRPKDIPMTE